MKNSIFALLFLLPTILLAQMEADINPQKAGFSKDRLEQFSAFWQKHIDEANIPGGVALIMRNGTIAHKATYGYKNVETKTPMQFDQIFYIQSMTKPIVSTAFMMLYEQGYFELNDPLHKYIPEFKAMKIAYLENGDMTMIDAKEPIRIWHLLSHTAGFSHGLGSSPIDIQYRNALYGASFPNNQHTTIEDRAMTLSKLPLVGEPGNQWYYSASTDLLALLIEQFSGMTTAAFLKKHIFEPLGMNDTGYNLNEAQAKRAVALHLVNEGKLSYSPRQMPTSENTIFGGTHGLFSTATDYMKFARMMLNGGELNGKRILSRKTVELMTANHVDNLRGNGEGFGLGFGIRTDLADGKTLGTEGQFAWGGAYNTYFFIDPEENMIAIFMMQFAPYTDYYSRLFRQMVYQAIED